MRGLEGILNVEVGRRKSENFNCGFQIGGCKGRRKKNEGGKVRKSEAAEFVSSLVRQHLENLIEPIPLVN